MIGKTISHYRVTAKLGAGGMGEVYLAHDERLEREVALKVLPAETLADEAARKRFRKEALALSKLNHPNIATIYDFDTQDGVDFLVMEYVEGTTLSEKLSNGALPEKDVAKLGGQVADALEEAHERGVIHRDLKPGNVMVTPKGQAKVLDFGLAKLAQPVSETAVTESLTEGPRLAGTLPYMAPEQLQGEEVDARTDLYALGTLLYQMATGQRPFPETQTPRLIASILNKVPVTPRAINARVSPELERIILKCLEKDPEIRYQSAKEIGVDLRRLGSPASVSAVIEPTPSRIPWPRAVGASLAVVALLAVLFALNVGGLRDRLRGGVTPGQIQSIAVLPLDNLMGDTEQEYFVEGMTEALTSELGKISALRVISRTSAQQIKKRMEETGESLQEISRQLNLDAVVEGSVLRSGERVRVTAQLIHAATDRHLWTESYERDLRNVLKLQSEVARAIAEEIKVALTPQEQARLSKAPTVNPDAHELYLKGRYLSNKWVGNEIRKSLDYFAQAIEIDPSYAQVYAGLAEAYILLGNLSHMPLKESHPKARTLAAKALEIDDDLAEAHVALAITMSEYYWNWLEAEKHFQRAQRLNPNSAPTHQWYAEFLADMGRFAEAIAAAKRARALDPLSAPSNATVGRVLYTARQYDQALEELQKTLDMFPEFGYTYIFLSLVYNQKEMYEEAFEVAQRGRNIMGDSPEPVALQGYALARAGKRREAFKLLGELQARSQQQYVPPFLFTILYEALGDQQRAIESLEEAFEDRSWFLRMLKVEPVLDPLRSDPRFQDLLRRMNFPE